LKVFLGFEKKITLIRGAIFVIIFKFSVDLLPDDLDPESACPIRWRIRIRNIALYLRG